MKYLTIDLETTGLDPVLDQILEIGMIVDDTSQEGRVKIEDLPSFHCYVKHENYHGQPKALAMNSRILDILAEGKDKDIIDVRNVPDSIDAFLNAYFTPGESITCAGKNFSSFDKPFLNRLKKFRFKHRAIDIGSMYWKPLEDYELPSMDLCCLRANVGKGTRHEALDDCRLVVACVRNWIAENWI